MRIGQQRAAPLGQAFRQVDALAIAGPIAVRGAGDAAGLRKLFRLLQERQVFECDLQRQPRTARHLEPMTQQPETGDVGDGVHVGILGQLGAHLVEQGGRDDHLVIAGLVQHLLLEGGGIDSDAQSLGQYQ